MSGSGDFTGSPARSGGEYLAGKHQAGVNPLNHFEFPNRTLKYPTLKFTT